MAHVRYEHCDCWSNLLLRDQVVQDRRRRYLCLSLIRKTAIGHSIKDYQQVTRPFRIKIRRQIDRELSLLIQYSALDCSLNRLPFWHVAFCFDVRLSRRVRHFQQPWALWNDLGTLDFAVRPGVMHFPKPKRVLKPRVICHELCAEEKIRFSQPSHDHAKFGSTVENHSLGICVAENYVGDAHFRDVNRSNIKYRIFPVASSDEFVDSLRVSQRCFPQIIECRI